MAAIFNLSQHFRMAEARTQAMNAKSEAESARRDVDDLHRQVDTLTLTCQALFETLRDHFGLPEEMLLAKLEEIDLRDGVADGKITRQPVNCPNCGRRSSSRRRNCLYCGERMKFPLASGDE